MPSQRDAGLGRICFFGDSHLASVKQALDGGLLRLDPAAVEFWGATGPDFRQLTMEGGRIRAAGKAAEAVAMINGHGRESLGHEDFELFIFYGARLRPIEFMGPYLHRACDGEAFESEAALRAAAEAWLIMTRAFRFAQVFGRAGARVIYVPGPLPTEGIKDYTIKDRVLQSWPRAAEAGADARARLWRAMGDVAAQSGVHLLAQPEETVMKGCFTDRKFAVAGAEESGDSGHKSPDYAALLVGLALEAAAQPA